MLGAGCHLADSMGHLPRAGAPGQVPVWLHDLADYLDARQVLLCPSDASSPTGSGVAQT
ncbi:MAG: hypothetical protein NZT92_16740 [Abditibacteriales bacterium]|nr:hypothetical protein [Abditibacteriales bacterium]